MVSKIRISFNPLKIDTFDVYKKWDNFFEKNKLPEVPILHKHKYKFSNKTDKENSYIDLWLRFTHLGKSAPEIKKDYI